MRYYREPSSGYFAISDKAQILPTTEHVYHWGREHPSYKTPIKRDWMDRSYFDRCREVSFAEMIQDDRSDTLVKYLRRDGETAEAFQKDLQEYQKSQSK